MQFNEEIEKMYDKRLEQGLIKKPVLAMPKKDITSVILAIVTIGVMFLSVFFYINGL